MNFKFSMVIINSCIILFNKAGNRLVSKALKIPTTDYNACSVDKVVLQKKLGQKCVEIFSYRDKNGKLIKRIQNLFNLDGSINQKTISDYQYTSNIFSNKRIVNRVTFSNNQLVSATIDNINKMAKSLYELNSFNILKTSYKKNFVNNASIKSNDTSFFGLFTSNSKPKKLIVESERSLDNSVEVKKIKYAGIDTQAAKELAKDPYLPMRLAPVDDFLTMLRHHVYKVQGVEAAEIKLFKGNLFFDGIDRSYEAGRMARHENGEIRIDLNKKALDIVNKPQIINTFHHEARHCRQIIYQEQLWLSDNQISPNPIIRARQFKFGPLAKSDEIELAKKINFAYNNYVDGRVDREKYINNFMELDANKFSTRAKDVYEAFAKKIKSIFKLTDEQVGLRR